MCISLLISFPNDALAQWVTEFSLQHLNYSEGGIFPLFSNQLHLEALSTSVGYQIPLNQKFTLIPEIQYSLGYQDDVIPYKEKVILPDGESREFESGKVTLSLTSYYSLNFKVIYHISDHYFVFVQPQITTLELQGKLALNSGEKLNSHYRERQLQYGIGMGYRFNPQLSVNCSYSKIHGDIIDLSNTMIGFRYNF